MSPPHIWWTKFHSLREEYQKSGGLVVTYFSYFHYFPNGGRFFLLGRVYSGFSGAELVKV